MSEIQTKIQAIKQKMEGLEEGSPIYQAYQEAIKELEKTIIGTPVLKVHQTPEVCESCQ